MCVYIAVLAKEFIARLTSQSFPDTSHQKIAEIPPLLAGFHCQNHTHKIV